MLEKGAKIDWTPTMKKALEKIKQEIVDAPVFLNLDYTKPFYIYYFTSERTCVTIIRGKVDDQDEHPIAFMSLPLKHEELNTQMLRNKITLW